MSRLTRGIAGRVLAVLSGCTLLFVACAAPGDGSVTTVFLVRHAEKADSTDDPLLTDAGMERALDLAHVLGEVNIAAVYSTSFIRTRETARPLAELRGLALSEVAADDYATHMASLIRTQHVGDVVVAVSHSNTVPALIEALGAGPAPVIDEDEYDDLYIVTIDARGNATLVSLRYGRESP